MSHANRLSVAKPMFYFGHQKCSRFLMWNNIYDKKRCFLLHSKHVIPHNAQFIRVSQFPTMEATVRRSMLLNRTGVAVRYTSCAICGMKSNTSATPRTFPTHLSYRQRHACTRRIDRTYSIHLKGQWC